MDPNHPGFTPGYGNYGGGYNDGQFYGAGDLAAGQQEGFHGNTAGAYGESSYGGSMPFNPAAPLYDPNAGMVDYSGHHPAAPVAPAVEPGFYFPLEGLQPQIFGAPVNSLAYDKEYQAIFVASATQSLSRGRFNHRASMLVAHSTVDGMLYSSVAGHPEGPPKVLNSIYESIYGSPPPVAMGLRTLPSHAFRPVEGGADPALPENGPRIFQTGIRTLLPTGHGYVASVSPSGVRLHSHGGLQLADHHTEGMLCGTLHPHHPDGQPTHLTVGGQALGKDISDKSGNQQVLCMDMWSDLRVVASYTTDRRATSSSSSTAVTTMATLDARSAVVAGCTDGTIRMIDSRMREMAKIRSHFGGVVSLAVSPDGTLLATTGFGSRGQADMGPLYAFPDPTVFLYDIRFLGRGGIPHPFAGVGAGPRLVSFLPEIDGFASNRFVVASGQGGGGLQILEPFQESIDVTSHNFIVPVLARGETITAMNVAEDRLGLGTSRGNVIQYQLAGLEGSQKKILELPSFTPPPPALSIDPAILSAGDPSIRNGMTDAMKSVFSAYILTKEATVSSVRNSASFGPLMSKPLIGGGKVQVSSSLLQNATHSVDFIQTIPTSNLEIDLLDDFSRSQYRRPGWEPQPNPNKLLQTTKLYRMAYMESLNRPKKGGRRDRDGDDYEETAEEGNRMDIPSTYRLIMRPAGKLAGLFSHADFNASGTLPGWDYPPTMPNAFVPSVLMVLYCIPETRKAMLRAQTVDRVNLSWKDKTLTPEIGFLFHRINALSRFGLIYPSSIPGNSARLEAWAPMNFMSCLASTPEAEQLQILDGSPAAVDMPRRAEAFYRFLLYQIDKESTKGEKMMEQLGGMAFTSVNEFVNGKGAPTTSSTRAMTVDMYYEPFLCKDGTSSFGEVLQQTLCREMPLRAWNPESGKYHTIVQRKIATSLPKLLSISCACAGRKEEEGLKLWRGSIPFGWLPEEIEIELTARGNVIVRQLEYDRETKENVWKEYVGKGSIPDAVSEVIAQTKNQELDRKRRYRLEAVVSLVRDDFDRKGVEHIGGVVGHQVLHVRVPKSTALQVMKSQVEETSSILQKIPGYESTIVNSSDVGSLETRLQQLEQRMSEMQVDTSTGEWYLMNGYAVSKSSSQDARAFHQKFREPSLCIFRAQDSVDEDADPPYTQFTVPPEIVRTQSLTNSVKSPHAPNQRPNVLPGEGDYVAFDAEFVSVQEEMSTLANNGAKVTIQEPRHVIARISIIDCRSRSIVIDDHVVPREPVVDYLTRFSGIIEKDLDPKSSTKHLISTRAAYLKLRLLIERGCIFVGHGLKQDFWTANLAVPQSQIVDTVEIYHKPAQRFISLRFLANFVLKRDMQQDIHDSVEDATAAFELYRKSVELKRQGKFSDLLDELYAHGQKTDWKIGVEDD
eukprot:scaffold362_cov176-Amphora_coffeaeformis.AAC.28